MSRDNKRRLTRTLVILGAVVGSSLAVYFGLVVSVGVSQPLMLVASNSMEPTISVGDIIVVRSANTSQVHLGDVIVYQKSLGKFSILHRVVCIVTSSGSSCTPPFYPYVNCYVPPCYYTKGDNNPAPDPWIVLSNEIRGVWTGFRIPYIGMSLICLQQGLTCPTPWGVISIVALGSAIVSDIGLEYSLSRKSTKHQLVVSQESNRASGRS